MARLLGYRWPDQEPDDLDSLTDEDGIVPIPAARGESPAAERLREVLRTAFSPPLTPPLQGGESDQRLATADGGTSSSPF